MAAKFGPRTVRGGIEHEIDDSVLPHLTEDHLREIGIPLGARIKLLKAIASRRERVEATSTSVESDAAPGEGAERRQLTCNVRRSEAKAMLDTLAQ